MRNFPPRHRFRDLHTMQTASGAGRIDEAAAVALAASQGDAHLCQPVSVGSICGCFHLWISAVTHVIRGIHA